MTALRFVIERERVVRALLAPSTAALGQWGCPVKIHVGRPGPRLLWHPPLLRCVGGWVPQTRFFYGGYGFVAPVAFSISTIGARNPYPP